MKKVLIMVVSSQYEPYLEMWRTRLSTWDKPQIENVETVFYFSNPVKENTDKEIYFNLPEVYQTMGEKMLLAFQWALDAREFDFIARVNSSCYVDKKELIKYVQTLPTKNLFAGGIVIDQNGNHDFCWGGLQYVISKDVIEKILHNKNRWQHNLMEDVSLSYLVKELKIPFTSGRGCSIDKAENGWRCLTYGGGENFEFTEFEDIKKANGQFFFRVKQDGKRWVDKFLMEQLQSVLQ